MNERSCVRVLLIIIWFGLVIVSGCTSPLFKGGISNSYGHQVVWADDGSEVAVIRLEDEENLEETTQKMPVKYKIIVRNFDGSKQQVITQLRHHQVDEFFYMKQAGYLVVATRLDNGKRRFDKIALNGNEIPIIEEQVPYKPCHDADQVIQMDHQVIPSPDGSLLVEVYSPECGRATVEFLHASNLSFIDSQTFHIDESMKVTWHPYGYIIFVNQQLNKAWKVLPRTPPMPIQPPRCFFPATTSSNLSLEGERVYFEGKVLTSRLEGRNQAFGCQQ